MARKISEKAKAAFAKFALERHADPEVLGSFWIGEVTEIVDPSGEQEWEFDVDDEDNEVYDFYDLFTSLPDGYEVEAHGHEDFCVIHEDDEESDEEE